MKLIENANKEYDVWDRIVEVRNIKRFKSLDILHHIFESFYELHGDRYYGDDKSVVGGIGFLDKTPVTVIAQFKGSNDKGRAECRCGMSLPEGYRKALRLMKQAEKFSRPIITMIDTPGAFPGREAEERGQAEAIARNLYEMSIIRVPIISIIVGEGGSGGALALAVANKIIMLEHSIFSVVSPEGCASILWKDSKKAPQAAKALKLSSQDLYSLGVIDEIINENRNFEDLCYDIKRAIHSHMKEYQMKTGTQIQEERFEKLRKIGSDL